ncbi:MAG: pyridoxal phosphate-dependent aminotransferase family protein [Pyrinomonadaceae bacterium]
MSRLYAAGSHVTAPAPDPLAGSTRDYLYGPDADVLAKTKGISAWLDARVAYGGFPFSKRLMNAPSAKTSVRLIDGTVSSGLNFASQDYLSLASHPDVRAAAVAAIDHYGVHSGGAPVLAGAIDLSDKLESVIATHLHTPHVMLCPTGWAAGYGAVRGIVRDTDYVVIDQLAHSCLQEGAAAATRNINFFRHLDLSHARMKLAAIRAKDAHNGILVVTEGLFSMDSDSPSLAGFISICRDFGARLVVDVAHDLGCTGPQGTGQLGIQNLLGNVDIIVGSFSKTFATNGGFIATRDRDLCNYLRYLSPPATFSSALAPAQVAVALAAFELVRSAEGDRRRNELKQAIDVLRAGFSARGVEVMGTPSPIVPVFIGRDDVGRIAARLLSTAGVLTNLVEYPAVSRATARFRLQVMSSHSAADCELAATRIAQAISQAREACAHRSSVAAA